MQKCNNSPRLSDALGKPIDANLKWNAVFTELKRRQQKWTVEEYTSYACVRSLRLYLMRFKFSTICRRFLFSFSCSFSYYFSSKRCNKEIYLHMQDNNICQTIFFLFSKRCIFVWVYAIEKYTDTRLEESWNINKSCYIQIKRKYCNL